MPQDNLHQTTPTKFLETGTATLSYRRFGNKNAVPVVFFQHFHGTMDNWDPILTNKLATTREVILFDNVGVGRSTGATPNSVAAMAKDSIVFIEKLGLSVVDLFGFSLGGFVAQEIAVQAPPLVRRVILAGTGPTGGERMGELSPEVMKIVNRRPSTFEERNLELFFSPSESSQAAGRAWLERVGSRKTDREPYASDAVAMAQMQAVQAWGRGKGDRRGYLNRIKHPVLVVNGNDDIMIPTINSYILQQELPNAQLIIYPDSGHAAHFQYSELFADEAKRFLGSEPAWS